MKKITFTQVERAAIEIIGQGEKPTIEKIRNKLGGIGSNTTIARYLNTWREENTISAVITTPDPVSIAVQSVWQKMQAEADEQVNKMRIEAELELALIKTDLEQSNFKKQELETNLSYLNNKVVHSEEVINCLEQQLATVTVSLTNTTTELSNKNQLLGELKDNYNVFMQETKKSHETEMSHLRNLMEDQRHNWLEKNDELKTQLAKLEQVVQAHVITKEQDMQRIKNLRNTIEQTNIELQQCKQNQETFVSSAVDFANNINMLYFKAEQHEAVILQKEQEITELKLMLAQKQNMICKLNSQYVNLIIHE